MLPRIVRLTLATNPAGLQVNLDGQPVTTPLSFDGVVGIVRNIEATTQVSGGTTYDFVRGRMAAPPATTCPHRRRPRPTRPRSGPPGKRRMG